MSYSICLKCKDIVGGYEKYCQECAKRYHQNRSFWGYNNAHDYFHDEEKRHKELCYDLIMLGGRHG